MCRYTVKNFFFFKYLTLPKGGGRLHPTSKIRRFRRKGYRKNKKGLRMSCYIKVDCSAFFAHLL